MIDYDALEEMALEQQYMAAFSGLSKTYVPGEGDNPTAFIIGEAPGADEDVRRRPFVGPAGQVLRQLMVLADLWASSVQDSTGVNRYPGAPNCWLTNVVKFRPPKNRKPTDSEIKASREYLIREWVAVGSPKLIIPVGGIALRAVTGKPISILRAAGKCHKYLSAHTGKTLYIWPMVHPSYAMRLQNEQLNELLEQDWERLGNWIMKERTSPIGEL